MDHRKRAERTRRQWVLDEIENRSLTLLSERSVRAALGLLNLGQSRDDVSAALANWNEDLQRAVALQERGNLRKSEAPSRIEGAQANVIDEARHVARYTPALVSLRDALTDLDDAIREQQEN